MSDPTLPDLSWEEITRNIEQMKQANSRRQTAVKNTYLEEILQVNAALQRGVIITIRVAGHHFTCPPGELHPESDEAEDGCLLLLRKVIVEFRQEEKNLVYSISLWFWDSTHEEDILWGATLVQPQWESIVKLAQNEEQVTRS